MVEQSRLLLVVDGQELDPLASRLVRYSFRSEVGKVPNAGELTIAPLTDSRMRAVFNTLREANRITVLLDGATASTGYITGNTRKASTSGASEAVFTVKDVLARPFKSTTGPGFSPTGLSVLDATRALLRPWGLEVEAGNAGNRVLCGTRLVAGRRPLGSIPAAEVDDALLVDAASRGDARALNAVAQHRAGVIGGGGVDGALSAAYLAAVDAAAATGVVVRAQKIERRDLVPPPGTEISRWLPDYLREAGLMVWASATGRVILSAPDYEQPPHMVVGYGTTRGMARITSSECSDTLGEQLTSSVVEGRAGERGGDKVRGVALDQALIDKGWLVYRYRHERELRDLDGARAKAEQALREEQLESWSYRFTMQGHGVLDALAAMDTMVSVRDQHLGVNRDLYVKAVDLSLPGDVPEATCECVLPGLWGAGAYAEGGYGGQP